MLDIASATSTALQRGRTAANQPPLAAGGASAITGAGAAGCRRATSSEQRATYPAPSTYASRNTSPMLPERAPAFAVGAAPLVWPSVGGQRESLHARGVAPPPSCTMKVMTRLVLLSLLLSGVAQAADPLPRQRPDAGGLPPARLARIAQVLEHDVAAGRMAGAVVAVARRGKLIYYEAFGYLDRAAGLRMPRDAIFSIASMTK